MDTVYFSIFRSVFVVLGLKPGVRSFTISKHKVAPLILTTPKGTVQPMVITHGTFPKAMRLAGSRTWVQISVCSILGSCAGIKLHDQKQLGKEWVYLFHPTVLHHCSSVKEVRAGTQGRNLEAGTEAEPMEECCLLACSTCFLLTQDQVPRGGTTHINC